MLKKIDHSKQNLLKNIDVFKCPICGTIFKITNNSLICGNNHWFDLSHKGVINLLNTNKKRDDKIYDRVLFSNRIKFIEYGFYDSLHKLISDYINQLSNANKILDLGSGDGTHDFKILKQLKNDSTIIGIDIAKDGVDLSTNYIENNFVPIVADLNNLPIYDDSIDVILNILSPSSEKEMQRVLKKTGKIIKVTPKKEYLMELRNLLNIKEYENEDIISQNIDTNYKIEEKFTIIEKHKLSKDQFNCLINMTPLTKNYRIANEINYITIALNIFILSIKE